MSSTLSALSTTWVWQFEMLGTCCHLPMCRVFAEVGTLSSAVVMRDMTGKSRGFGFVNYERAEDAADAVDRLNGHVDEEKEWEVTKAQKKAEREAELRAKFEKVRVEAFGGRGDGQMLFEAPSEPHSSWRTSAVLSRTSLLPAKCIKILAQAGRKLCSNPRLKKVV